MLNEMRKNIDFYHEIFICLKDLYIYLSQIFENEATSTD